MNATGGSARLLANRALLLALFSGCGARTELLDFGSVSDSGAGIGQVPAGAPHAAGTQAAGGALQTGGTQAAGGALQTGGTRAAGGALQTGGAQAAGGALAAPPCRGEPVENAPLIPSSPGGVGVRTVTAYALERTPSGYAVFGNITDTELAETFVNAHDTTGKLLSSSARVAIASDVLEGADAVVDASGNGFVAATATGSRGGTTAILLSAGMTPLSVQSGLSGVRALRVAAGGGRVVALSDGGAGTKLLTFAEAGRTLWVQTIDQPPGGIAQDVAVATGGNAVVSGVAPSDSGWQWFVIAFGGHGETLWLQRFGCALDPTHVKSPNPVLEADADGSIVLAASARCRIPFDDRGLARVVGSFNWASAEVVTAGTPLVIQKLSTSGDPLWALGLEPNQNNWPIALAVDPEGYLLLSEGTHAQSASAQTVVTKADRNGALLWSSVRTGDLVDLATDDQCNAYVAHQIPALEKIQKAAL